MKLGGTEGLSDCNTMSLILGSYQSIAQGTAFLAIALHVVTKEWNGIVGKDLQRPSSLNS